MIQWLSKQRWAPVNCYGPCVGLTLYKLGRHKLELWYAPATYSPPMHSHNNSDGEFFVLYGKGRAIWKYPLGDCIARAYNISDRTYWKWWSVRAYEQHGFSKGATCMIWLCWEKWKPGTKVTSVAEDFVLA